DGPRGSEAGPSGREASDRRPPWPAERPRGGSRPSGRKGFDRPGGFDRPPGFDRPGGADRPRGFGRPSDRDPGRGRSSGPPWQLDRPSANRPRPDQPRPDRPGPGRPFPGPRDARGMDGPYRRGPEAPRPFPLAGSPEALAEDEELVAGRRPVEEAFAARRSA